MKALGCLLLVGLVVLAAFLLLPKSHPPGAGRPVVERRSPGEVPAVFPRLSEIAVGESAEFEKFHGCPPQGSLKRRSTSLASLNVLKNRYRRPEDAPQVPIQQLLGAKVRSRQFSPKQGATVDGYVAAVILEEYRRDGEMHSESCNCDLTGEMDADDHIYVAGTLRALEHYRSTHDKSEMVIAEITPRMKELAARNGFNWTTDALKLLIGRKVRLTGWLMSDFEHKNVSAADGAEDPVHRGTCWELHPVTRIEMLD